MKSMLAVLAPMANCSTRLGARVDNELIHCPGLGLDQPESDPGGIIEDLRLNFVFLLVEIW